MELDVYQSDGDTRFSSFFGRYFDRSFGPVDDVKTGDDISFNDGYVFINSGLGNIKFGDTDAAGLATNQLNVPVLPVGAAALENFHELRREALIFIPRMISEKKLFDTRIVLPASIWRPLSMMMAFGRSGRAMNPLWAPWI